MISSIKITEGYATELPALAGKTFEFTPGLNLLFGPNGCGKTSILKIAAGYSAVDTSNRQWGGGWSKTPHMWGDELKFPEAFKETTTGHCGAEVVWDGTPSFYGSAYLSDNPQMSAISWDEKDSPDGITDGMAHISMITSRMSEGQTRDVNLGRMHKAIQTVPAFRKDKSFDAYLETLPKNGPPTVFLDEPDRSLDFDNQLLVWLRFIPDLVTNRQVIVASHSVVPLLAREKIEKKIPINFIDFKPAYTATCLENLAYLAQRK